MEIDLQPLVELLFSHPRNVELLREYATQAQPEMTFTDDELRAKFEAMPRKVISEAITWGISDSVVRDNIFILFKNNFSERSP